MSVRICLRNKITVFSGTMLFIQMRNKAIGNPVVQLTVFILTAFNEKKRPDLFFLAAVRRSWHKTDTLYGG